MPHPLPGIRLLLLNETTSTATWQVTSGYVCRRDASDTIPWCFHAYETRHALHWILKGGRTSNQSCSGDVCGLVMCFGGGVSVAD